MELTINYIYQNNTVTLKTNTEGIYWYTSTTL